MLPKRKDKLGLNDYACKRLIDAGLKHAKSGKTTEVFKIPGYKNLVLLYATDRVSAFNIVLDFHVEVKGTVVACATVHWLRGAFNDLENHLVASGHKIYDYLPADLQEDRFTDFPKRCLIVTKANILPIKAVVRGYLTGAAFRAYQETGSICGKTLPKGLEKGDKLPEPIFTPSTKTEPGKPNRLIDMTELSRILQSEILAQAIRARSKYIFRMASRRVERNGMTLADTKLKWGLDKKGKLLLVGKVLTPDSSRFWQALGQDSHLPMIYGKELIKNWCQQANIEKNPHAIPGPVAHTQMRNGYFYAFQGITGKGIQEFCPDFPKGE